MPTPPKSAEDALDELVLVNRVAERVAEGRVEQRLRRRAAALDRLAVRRAVAVERELGPPVRGPDHGRDPDVRLERLQLLGDGVAGVVDLARLERLHHRVGALVEDDDDLVGCALRAPVLGVAHEAGELAGLPLGERVRAGADERRLELGLGDPGVVELAPDVLRDDRQVRLEDPIGRVLRVGDHRRVVGALDLGDAGVGEAGIQVSGADVRLVGDRRHGQAPRIAGVLGGGRGTVRPLQPIAELEGPGLSVGGALPALREARHGLQVRPEVDEQVVGELEDLVADDEERLVGVGRVEVLDRADSEDDLVVGRPRPGARAPAGAVPPRGPVRRAGERSDG